ncbi:hypothetical protein MTO96_003597 [Rhipicephalus appendiculatus]
MSRHEGVSCDSCMKANFRGKRYKCLICYDYDLCGTCYEAGATNTRHTPDHAMQCILTRSDFDLYYGGEAVSVEQPQSFTCPICGKMGFTELTLQEHVTAEHTDASSEVVCPVCAALPGGEPNHVTEDFAAHLSLEHRSNRDLDEPSGSRHVRRIPHPAGRGMSSARARRSQMQFSSTGGLSALSPSNRDSMDPIAELLSQLSSGAHLASPATAAATLHCPQTATTPASAPSGEAPAPAAHFLLSRCAEPSLVESEQQALELERADRSLFAQELLLTTLAERLHWPPGGAWTQQDTSKPAVATAPPCATVETAVVENPDRSTAGARTAERAQSERAQPDRSLSREGRLSPSRRKVVRVLDERNKLKEPPH